MNAVEGFERALRDADQVEATRALMYLESQGHISTMELRLFSIIAKAVIRQSRPAKSHSKVKR